MWMMPYVAIFSEHITQEEIWISVSWKVCVWTYGVVMVTNYFSCNSQEKWQNLYVYRITKKRKPDTLELLNLSLCSP